MLSISPENIYSTYKYGNMAVSSFHTNLPVYLSTHMSSNLLYCLQPTHLRTYVRTT